MMRMLPELGPLPPTNTATCIHITLMLYLIFFLYFLCLVIYSRSAISVFEKSLWAVYFWAATTWVYVLLCYSHPVLSRDLYEYAIRGRMLSVYGLNPYLHAPSEVQQDMFFPFLFWKNTHEVYGLLWTWIGVFNTKLFPGSLKMTTFMHKLSLLVFLLMSVWVFYKICTQLGLNRPELATLAWSINPLLILMTLVDGHNDIAMVFFMLCCLYFLLRSQYVLSMVLFTAAVQVKFVYAMIAPLLLLYLLFAPEEKPIRVRLKELAFGTLLSAGLTLMLWQPLGMEGIGPVLAFFGKLGRVVCHDSLAYLVFQLLNAAGVVISEKTTIHIFSILFYALYLFLIYAFITRIKQGGPVLVDASSLIFLSFFLTNHTPLHAWYLIWVIPFILLSRFRAKFMMVFFLSFFLIMVFWKRASVIIIQMAVLYAIVWYGYERNRKEDRFSFAMN
jgi:hypothetical protein